MMRACGDVAFKPVLLSLVLVAAGGCGGPIGPVPRPAPVPAGPAQGPAAARPLPDASSASVRVGFFRGGSYEVSTLALEPYVARVLGGEAAPDTRPGAMEALAIAVRTYALANLGRHSAEGFDLCDQTHCQVVRRASPATESAAGATAGAVLLDAGVPATIYYSASCGGRSEVPSAVWPGARDVPFLPSRQDEACRGLPEWSTDIALSDIERALLGVGYIGKLRRVRVVSRNSSKRVATLRVEGMTPDNISGQDFRMAVGRVLGPLAVRSTAFELEELDDSYRFEGHGYGHGVGMCVMGAMQLALDGRSAEQILNRYFPGLRLGRLQRSR
jgi:stage II sporulation protein D